MEIAGKIVQVLPLQTGEGKNGPWKKQDFVLETDAQYPKKICIAVWGDKIEGDKITVGNQVCCWSTCHGKNDAGEDQNDY